MSTTDELSEAEVFELEPTLNLELADYGGGADHAAPRAGAGVALVEGTLASFASDTDTLRRQRLLAAAVFLTATFGLLFCWVFASDNPGTMTVDGSRYSLRVGLIALRCVLAAVVAGLLVSEVP